MAVIIHKMIEIYTHLNEDLSDPRTKNLFLIDTLWRTPVLFVLYILFTTVYGPKFMEKRQRYKLDKIIQIYNILQIIANIYIFYLALTLTWLKGYSLTCEPIDYSYTPRPIEISRGVFYYFLIKILDLLDTVFFILMKKQRHVSFLHVYHHGGMLLAAWVGVKYLAGGSSIFLGTVNTFVHSIMYTYYLLSSMKINTGSWKKYITQLQMIQFGLIFLYYFQIIWADCDYPLWAVMMLMPQNIFIFILFGEFYYKTYMTKKPASVAAPTTIKENVSAEIVSNGKVKKQ